MRWRRISKAFKTDPTSAFGGIIAFNVHGRRRSGRKQVSKQFVEVLMAPDFTPEALAVFKAKAERARAAHCTANVVWLRTCGAPVRLSAWDRGLQCHGRQACGFRPVDADR
jgi:hypothetical protein